MVYNKYEFTENLKEEVISLGLSEKLIKNPAFDRNCILSDVVSMMNQTSQENINVTKDASKIQIDYNTLNGKALIEILKLPTNPNNFYIRTKLDEKVNSNIDEIKYNLTKIELDEITGQIKTENKNATFTIINGIDTEISISNRQRFFDSYGIENERIYKLYDIMIFDKSVTDMLTSSYDVAFNHMNGFMSPSDNQLVYASSIRRKGIDTARVYTAEKEDGMLKIKYDTELMLSNEHGLQEININSGVNGLTTYIPKLTDQELEEKINNENNPIVREGLRKRNNEILDRTKVDYDPELDKDLKIEKEENILKTR
jgi:hypothetical protein